MVREIFQLSRLNVTAIFNVRKIHDKSMKFHYRDVNVWSEYPCDFSAWNKCWSWDEYRIESLIVRNRGSLKAKCELEEFKYFEKPLYMKTGFKYSRSVILGL